MPQILLFVFEIIGTVAFAWSGAMTAVQKKMDIFGVMILGLTTAVGGGVIRDLILGITPPNMFRNPVYALVAFATAVVVFLPAVRRWLSRSHVIHDFLMMVMDAVGLGAFTVVGVQVACESGQPYNLFLLIFVGTVTGVGGGVLRDVMACTPPYIFVKHFYATASVLGAALCAGLWPFVDPMIAMLSGAAAVVILRVCAACFHWSLPKA
jgi:uncharacterized membrane protein YeiH